MSDRFARRARGQKTVAVERREASVPRRADGVSYLRGDARTYGSAPKCGCCASIRRLSALRPLTLCEREIGKPRRTFASREYFRLLALSPSS